MSRTLFTIGFTRKGAERFFGLLDTSRVRILLDIRARPDSQLAGFARGPDLAWLLQRVSGIEYLAVPSLAPDKALLADYRAGKLDWEGYARRYRSELDTGRSSQAIIGLDLDRACLLCAEESPAQCHRRLAAEWLQQQQPSLTLQHLR